jgi:hypothetical protein
MPSSIEARLARLEESRYRMVGQLNAHRAVLLSAWMTLLARGTTSPEDAIAQLKQALLQNQIVRPFPGASAAELEVFSQEYENSIEGLLADLERAVVAPASDRQV